MYTRDCASFSVMPCAVDMAAVMPALQRHALPNERGTQQVGKTDAGRTRAKEQVLLVFQLCALELGRGDHAGKRDAGGALHVVVVDAILVAVALKQVNGVDSGPILEVNAALRKHLLHRFDELVDEGIEPPL